MAAGSPPDEHEIAEAEFLQLLRLDHALVDAFETATHQHDARTRGQILRAS